MTGDLIWLNRFASHADLKDKLSDLSQFSKPTTLKQTLCHRMEEYSQQRQRLD